MNIVSDRDSPAPKPAAEVAAQYETVQSLKEELRRANEHIYELYQRLADKEKH
jgi:hypothetical protein